MKKYLNMKKYLLLLATVLFSVSLDAQVVNRFRDSTVFFKGVSFEKNIYSKGQVYLDSIPDITGVGALYIAFDSFPQVVNSSTYDSIVLSSFDGDYSKVCRATLSGQDVKIRKRDNVRLVIDTTNYPSCTGEADFTILSFKYSNIQIPDNFYVDTFMVYISGYDTLNVDGNAQQDGHSPFFMSYVFSDELTSYIKVQDEDNPYTLLGNPSILEPPLFQTQDTVGIINYHFGKHLHSIDSIIVNLLIPLKGNIDFQAIYDRMMIIMPLFPEIKTLGLIGNQVVSGFPTGSSGGAYTEGNGINFRNQTEIELGDLNTDTYINGNGYQYQLYGADGISLTSNSNLNLQGNTVNISSNNDNLNLFAGNGRMINLLAGNGSGGRIVMNTNGGDGIFIPGLFTDNNIPYVLGSYSNDGLQSIQWRSVESLSGSSRVHAVNGLTNVDDSTVSLGGDMDTTSTINTNSNRLYISSDINSPGSGSEFLMASPGSYYKSGIVKKGSDFGIGVTESGSGRQGYMYLGTVPDETAQVPNGNYNPNITITRIPNFSGTGLDYNSIDINAGGFGFDTTANLRISTNQNSAYIYCQAKTNIPMSSPLANQYIGFTMDTMFQVVGLALNNTNPRYVVTGSGNVGSGEILTFTNIDTIRKDPVYYFTPLTGELVESKVGANIIEPAGSLAVLTVNLPSSPSNGDVVSMVFTESVTTISFQNGTFVNPITTITAGNTVSWQFYSGTGKWYKK